MRLANQVICCCCLSIFSSNSLSLATVELFYEPTLTPPTFAHLPPSPRQHALCFLVSKNSLYRLQAKKKPIEVLTPADVGVDFTPKNTIIKVEEPAARKAGIFVETTDALVDKLKNEAKVI